MKGIQTTPFGFRAYVRLKGYALQTKRFPKGTSPEVMQRWRELTRARLIVDREDRQRAEPPPPNQGTFSGAAQEYLATVTALITYSERVLHIHEWIAYFGDQDPRTITAAQIRKRRDTMLMVGPKWVQRKVKGKREWVALPVPLSAGSVNKRLRALENLFTVLWPGTPNPVRQVPEPEEPAAIRRALPAPLIVKLLAAMPPSKTRARLAVMRWTGLPHKTLGRLTPADVDLVHRRITLPGRKKGQGTRGRTLPLLPAAVTAFREFIRWHAWGLFSASGMHKSVQLACQKIGAPSVTPYQLRHTFGTEFLAATKDLRATQHALDHSTPRLTEAYAQASVDPALVHAYKQMAKAHLKKR